MIVKEASTLQAKTVFYHGFALNKLAHSTCDRDHTHLIEFAHACGYYFFRWAPGAATIRDVASIRVNTV